LTGWRGPYSKRGRKVRSEHKSGSGIASKDANHHQRKEAILIPSTEQDKIDLILSASVHLVSISINRQGMANPHTKSYSGVMGSFCRVDWSKHKNDPSSYPMFRDLVSASEGCKEEGMFQMDLKKAAGLARDYDRVMAARQVDLPRTLNPDGFVFHESRCGSTLVANSLAVVDPVKNRSYSESAPPITALKACGLNGEICPVEKAALLFRDVIYMMGRTDDPDEEHLFFKIQSIGTRSIDVFLAAYPETPWIFVYRDPVQVLMSQLAHGPERANCVHQLSAIPPHKMKTLSGMGLDIRDLSPEEKCALHLVRFFFLFLCINVA